MSKKTVRLFSWTKPSLLVVLFLITLYFFDEFIEKSSNTQLKPSLVKSEDFLEIIEPNEIEFNSEYEKVCGMWKEEVKNWTKFLKKSKPGRQAAVMGNQIRSGLGDRLSGLVAIFNRALEETRPFRIRWRDFDLAFELTDFVVPDHDTFYARIVGSGKALEDEGCNLESYYSCNYAFHERDRCPVYARACISESRCLQMKSVIHDFSMKHVVGCPLRTIIKPTSSLLNTNFEFHVDGEYSVYSLKYAMEEFLRNYVVISIHLRMGDYSFKSGLSEQATTPIKDAILGCLENFSSERKDKPIKWFIASDDFTLKTWFIETFPEKVIALKNKAHHISFVNKMDEIERKQQVLFLYAEWLLIGNGDFLVTNEAHSFGVSSFSRLSWLYNLKDEYFSIDPNARDTCVLRKFDYVGNLGLIPDTCRHG